jgi:hypothetical protein
LSTIERYLAISLEFLQRDGQSWIADEGCQIDRDSEDRSVRSLEAGRG